MISQLRGWWSAATRRTRFEDEMRAEIEFHLQARIDDLVAAGRPRAEAERQARMEFGTADAIKDDCRQSRGLAFLDTTIQDLRYAWRMMRKTPGFTAAAIMSLALGIGANTAIFTLVEAVMLRTMPIADPDRLFYFAHGSADNPGTSSNYGLFEQYAALTGVFDGVTAYNTNAFKVTTPDGIESIDGLWVSGNFHAVAGVPIALGRGFAAERDRDIGASMIAVISDHYWARRFNRSSNVLGHPLVVNGHTVTIVGVTAPEFSGLQPGTRPDVTLPLSVRVLDDKDFLDMRDTWTSLSILGRLKPDVSEAQATAAADVALQQFMAREENQWIVKRWPGAFTAARLMPAAKGSRSLRQRYETPLTVLMSLVGLILLIAATNVANLLLVRGEARAKEVAIRLCVGGGRLRLIRQFLTESLLLAIVSALLGFVLAQWGTQAIMAFFESLEQPIFLDVSPNLRVLSFTTAIALATALLFGLTPALNSTRVELTPALKDGGGNSGSARRRWTVGYTLVVTQVALGVVVIAVAGLLARSLYNLKTLDAGFDGDHVLVFTLDSYGTALHEDRRAALYAELLARLHKLPGAIRVAASRSVPIHTSGNARLLDLPGPPDTSFERSAFTNAITPGYFDAFGIRLLRGRDFNDYDTSASPRVAMISTTMARLYFGDRDPLGETIGFQSEKDKRLTVVGVVEDTHQMNLRENAPAIVYTPMAQETPQFWINFAIRTAQEPAALSAAAVAAARSASKHVVIRYVRTMEQQVNASLVRERLLASFSAGFAVLALILAAVGLYGVMSYNVTRRRREIGIRMALGARRGSVLIEVLRQTVVVSMIGIAIGVIAVLLTTQYMTTLLFGLSERDPATLAAVAMVLLLTASVAGFFPAHRAATIDPVRAIKTE
jgi:predicted permease